MSTWANQRKFLYLTFLFVFLILLLGVPTTMYLYKPPSCTDNKQNQGELGVDCGGPCKTLCRSQSLDPIILWQRVFPVISGTYNAVALVENPNINSAAREVPYRFKIYDGRGVIIAERQGVADIVPNKIYPIFESGLFFGDRIPVRVSFEFLAEPVWKIVEHEDPSISIVDKNLYTPESKPRLEAKLRSSSIKPVSKLEIVAIIYDVDGNAFASSKTLVDYIERNQTIDLVFTWPKAFEKEVSRIEIIPKFAI
jgi:hypothetical protein